MLLGPVGLSVMALIAAAAADEKPATEIVPPLKGKSEKFHPFNGKDLKDWNGNEKLWSVDGDEIVGKNTEPVPVSTYLMTTKTFSDFRFIGKVKLVKSEMHSGIAFWGQAAPSKGDPHTYAGHLVMFPSGWGMYDLYGRGGLPVDGKPAQAAGKQHDWNNLEILAQGNRVRVAVNGKAVVDWRDPVPATIKVGPIGLQLHSNKVPQEVRFKDMEITTFPPEDRLLTVK
jgi:hypothetical protein